MLNYPGSITSDVARYRHVYSAAEALRLKHNTRADDLKPEAVHFRRECSGVWGMVRKDILALRPRIVTPGWKFSIQELVDPLQTQLKDMGRSNSKDANLKDLTGVDLDDVTGGAPLGPDPLEDFTTYTEVDPNSHVTVTSTKLDVNNLGRDEDVWVYDDKGEDHFVDEFEHDWKLTIQASSYDEIAVLWWVSTIVESYYYWIINDSESICALVSDFSVDNISVRDNKSGNSDLWGNYSVGVPYYMTSERTGETAFEMRIYSDEARTNSVDTLVIAITSGDRYQFVGGVNTYNDGHPNDDMHVDVEDFDLKEGVAEYESAFTMSTGITLAGAGAIVSGPQVALALGTELAGSGGVASNPQTGLALGVGVGQEAGATAGGLLALVTGQDVALSSGATVDAQVVADIAAVLSSNAYALKNTVFTLPVEQSLAATVVPTVEARVALGFASTLSILAQALSQAGLGLDAVQSITFTSIGVDVVLTDGRTLTVIFETRTLVVDAENRVLSITAENRIVEA